MSHLQQRRTRQGTHKIVFLHNNKLHNFFWSKFTQLLTFSISYIVNLKNLFCWITLVVKSKFWQMFSAGNQLNCKTVCTAGKLFILTHPNNSGSWDLAHQPVEYKKCWAKKAWYRKRSFKKRFFSKKSFKEKSNWKGLGNFFLSNTIFSLSTYFYLRSKLIIP